MKIQKRKKKPILINSTTLEELEKKNMRCKEFFIEEKTQIFQNIDHRRSIVQNIYIHSNSFCSNIVIFPLSSRIIVNDIINKKENRYRYSSNLNLNYMDIESSNSLIKINNLRSGSGKHKNIESPVDQSCLYKKELGERKLRKSNNDINSNIYNSLNEDGFIKDKYDKNKEKSNMKKNESEKYIVCSKQLSTETLATEISRIIKVCHNDKNVSSFELSRGDSKIEETEEIIKARKYAKKLKNYCRTLKNKYPKRNNKKKRINTIENKPSDSINKEPTIFIEKIDKNSIHKVKRNEKKKHSEKRKGKGNFLIDTENENNNVKNTQINKKIKSERNINKRIKRENFVNSEENNNNKTEQSIVNQIQNKTIDVEQNPKIKNNNSNFVKITKKRTKKNNENDNKNKIKKQKDKAISPKKKNYKKELLQNIMKKIKKKISGSSNNEKNKTKKNVDTNNYQEEDSLLNEFKRNSIDTRMIGSNNSGLECVFVDTKKLSISEGISAINKKKKKIANLNQTFNDNNNKYLINDKENIGVTLIKKKNKQRRTKINLTNKESNEEKIEIKKIKKTNTFILKKNKKNKNKRKISTNFSEIKNEDENVTTVDNSIKPKYFHNSKKTTLKYDESFPDIKNYNYYTNEDKDDFNILDEYLYNKKHKRIKNKK